MNTIMMSCLKCGENPILKNGERQNILKFGLNDKHWDLCAKCYSDCYGANADCQNAIDYQREYFKKYKTYGILKSKGGPLCLWYSVRPPDGTDEYRWVERMSKFISSNCIEKAVYTFEWKYQNQGRTLGNRYGMHCHMLIVGPMGRVNAHIGRQSEKYWLLDESKQKFWIYESHRYLVEDKKKYFIDGVTDDPEKDLDKAYDKKVRKHLGLDENYYKCAKVGLCDFV